MIPRQTTLCVPHFIEYAVAKYDLEQEIPDGKKKQAKTQSRASSATRVQPRRAAKQVRKSYAESSSESGDLNDEDDEQDVPASKKEKAEAAAKTVQSKIDRVIDQLPQDRTVCIFGPRPWICESCREEKAATGESQAQCDKTDTDTCQPEAAMEPGMGSLPDGELLLDWSDVLVSSNSIFRLEGHHFTVDACYSPMVMRL